MTVQELIDLLNKIEDKTQKVKIGVHTYIQAYPVAYCDPLKTSYLNQAWGEVRIWTWLPDNMYVGTRKKK